MAGCSEPVLHIVLDGIMALDDSLRRNPNCVFRKKRSYGSRIMPVECDNELVGDIANGFPIDIRNVPLPTAGTTVPNSTMAATPRKESLFIFVSSRPGEISQAR